MQLADILSDLQTLRTCDRQDALNLVALPPTTASAKTEDTGEDLLRAIKFLQLYSTLKARNSRKLEELRVKVEVIVDRKLGRGVLDDLREVNAPGGF
ncbi:hypothetical protein EV426DRAFT_716837 [Tirmania nivea]|nr:hypothetical protein EV426DRAFT_716837 [Tirmania nivea]